MPECVQVLQLPARFPLDVCVCIYDPSGGRWRECHRRRGGLKNFRRKSEIKDRRLLKHTKKCFSPDSQQKVAAGDKVNI